MATGGVAVTLAWLRPRPTSPEPVRWLLDELAEGGMLAMFEPSEQRLETPQHGMNERLLAQKVNPCALTYLPYGFRLTTSDNVENRPKE